MSEVKRYFRGPSGSMIPHQKGEFVLASDYDTLAAQHDGGLAREAELRKWEFCPECGSEDLHHQEGTHKQCGRCHQEYWSDIDYSDVVRGHLAKLQPLQQRLAEAEQLLRECNEGFKDFISDPFIRRIDAFLADPCCADGEKP